MTMGMLSLAAWEDHHPPPSGTERDGGGAQACETGEDHESSPPKVSQEQRSCLFMLFNVFFPFRSFRHARRYNEWPCQLGT